MLDKRSTHSMPHSNNSSILHFCQTFKSHVENNIDINKIQKDFHVWVLLCNIRMKPALFSMDVTQLLTAQNYDINCPTRQRRRLQPLGFPSVSVSTFKKYIKWNYDFLLIQMKLFAVWPMYSTCWYLLRIAGDFMPHLNQEDITGEWVNYSTYVSMLKEVHMRP